MGLARFMLFTSGIWGNGGWAFIGSKLGDWSLATAAAMVEWSVWNRWNGFGSPGRSRLFGRKWDTPGGSIRGEPPPSVDPATLIGGYRIIPNGDPGNPGCSAENGEALPALESGDDADNAGGDCDEMAEDDDDVTIEADILSRSSETGFETCSCEWNGNGSFGSPSFKICARLVVTLQLLLLLLADVVPAAAPSWPSWHVWRRRCCSSLSRSVNPCERKIFKIVP